MSIRPAVALLCVTACLTAAAQTSDSLIDAARRNDYAAFEDLFAREVSPARAARDLHEVWTYALNEPTGAFYGGDMYNQLVSAYPDFAGYIQELAVDDAHGNRFYPTAETKKFLVEKLTMPSRAPVERSASSPADDQRDAGRSTIETVAPPDAFAGDLAKLGEFPAPSRRTVAQPKAVAEAQMVISTESVRGIFFVIVALLAAGVGIITVRTPGERTD